MTDRLPGVAQPRPEPRATRSVATWASAVVALVVVAIVGLTAASAAGDVDDSTTFVAVTKVDARTSTVELVVAGADPTTGRSGVELTAGDRALPPSSVTSARAAARPTEVVVVVDVGARGLTDDVLGRTRSRLAQLVAALPADVEVGVVAAGDRALVLQRPTTDRERLDEAIASLGARTGSSIIDAVGAAAELVGDDPTAVQSVLVVATGGDTTSSSAIAPVEADLIAGGIQLVAVGLDGGAPRIVDAAPRTGGVALSTGEASIEATIGAGWELATDRLVITLDAPADLAERENIVLTAGGASTEFSYPPNLVTTTVLQLGPSTPIDSSGPGLLGSSIALYLALAFSFVGISLGIWSLASIMLGNDASLDGMLSSYTDAAAMASDDSDAQEMLVQSALLQRAVDFSESFAESRGFLARIEDLLERANLPVRAGEAMFLMSAGVILAAGLVGAVTRSALTALIVAAGFVGLSFFALRIFGRRRFKAFEAQLPDTLQLLSGTLRAGYSLPQGFEAVSQEIADPMGQELRRAMTEARLGRELEESLNGVAERMASADFAWTVMAISIQREVGGNLNELLMSVADTMIARERLKREISALTAEGRMSAGLLSFLPPGLGMIMWVLNPDYIELLFTEFLGNVLLGLGLTSALIGLAWMKKVITVDV